LTKKLPRGFRRGCAPHFVVLAVEEMERGVCWPCLHAAATNLFLKATYYPAFASQRTLKSFALRLRENIDPQTPFLFYNSFDCGTVFYSRRHIAQYGEKVNEFRPPVFAHVGGRLERLRQRNNLEMLDISEGRGPASEHRLVLVSRRDFFRFRLNSHPR
jgi:hypothetical protein